jgi:hypothetical protein
MTRWLSLGSVLLLAALAPACSPVHGDDERGESAASSFADYWFAGKAELSRYALEQARYGEIREGDAVLIFVTEDFLPDKQVKSEGGDRAKTGALPVLKLNYTKTFETGLYPYSIMTSVFTPLETGGRPRTLKTSTSVQEWCGHTWLQLNLRGEEYRLTGHSYFESEADEAFSLPARWLEDEIWTRTRLAPASLPTGEVEVIPGGQQSRLRHRRPAVETARASLRDNGDGSSTYTLEYAAAGRTLAIRFESSFPHGILGWEERDRGALTTRATRTHVMREAYWRLNRNADAPRRADLGLQ